MNWKCFFKLISNPKLNNHPSHIDYSLPSVDLVKLLDSGVSLGQGQRIVTVLLKRLIEEKC